MKILREDNVPVGRLSAGGRLPMNFLLDDNARVGLPSKAGDWP